MLRLDHYIVGNVVHKTILIRSDEITDSMVLSVSLIRDGIVYNNGTILSYHFLDGVYHVEFSIDLPDSLFVETEGTEYFISVHLNGNVDGVRKQIEKDISIVVVQSDDTPNNQSNVIINVSSGNFSLSNSDINSGGGDLATSTITAYGSCGKTFNPSLVSLDDENMVLNTDSLPYSFSPYSLIVDVNGNLSQYDVYQVSPMMLRTAQELYNYIDGVKQRTRSENLDFTLSEMFQFLDAGKNDFNMVSSMSNITMLGASGIIKSLWMDYSRIRALETLFLREGMSSFEYSGHDVTLSYDITSIIESMIDKLKDGLQERTETVKSKLKSSGSLSGDGSNCDLSDNVDISKLGVVGLARHPASNIAR
jgi:hypothetical protein